MADHIDKRQYAQSEAAAGQGVPLSTPDDLKAPDFSTCHYHGDRYGEKARFENGENITRGWLCHECLRERSDRVVEVIVE